MATHTLGFLLLTSLAVQVLAVQNFWYNVHDGQNRLKPLTEADIGEQLASTPLAVVWVRTAKGQDKVIESVTDQMMQLSAQYLETKGALFGTLDLAQNSKLVTDYGLENNMILTFRNGRQVVYNGYRSAEVLIAFLEKMGNSTVSVIDGKATKKVFDRLPSTKVVGYFALRDTALQDFEEASLEFQPDIPFFVVHDTAVAAKLKMNVSGEIHVILPFDKQKYVIPQNPATIDDIRIFLLDNSRQVLSKLTLENMHSLWENVNENLNNVLAFSSRHTPEGPPFYKVLKKITRTLVNETALQVTVIETDKFNMVLPHWEKLYNISLSQPALGLVNLTDNNSTWFDIPAMQTLVNQTDREAMMAQWFQDIIQGVVRVDGLEPAVPEPVVDPASPDAAADPASNDQAAPPVDSQQPDNEATPSMMKPVKKATRTPEL